jgi:hypothetical protein
MRFLAHSLEGMLFIKCMLSLRKMHNLSHDALGLRRILSSSKGFGKLKGYDNPVIWAATHSTSAIDVGVRWEVDLTKRIELPSLGYSIPF